MEHTNSMVSLLASFLPYWINWQAWIKRSIRDDAQTDYFYFSFLLAMAILLLMIEPFIREQSARRLSGGPVTFCSTAFYC